VDEMDTHGLGCRKSRDIRHAIAQLMPSSREPCQQLGCLHNWNLRALALPLALGLMGSHWSHGSGVVPWHRTSLVQAQFPGMGRHLFRHINPLTPPSIQC
jgi:hypothetical protein